MQRDPYKYFRVEARELVDQLGKEILALEKSAPASAAEIVGRLLRLAHTLKGAARIVKQGAIADAAHAMEDVLAPVRAAVVAPPRETIDALLALVDRMEAALADIAPAPVAIDAPPQRKPAEQLAPVLPSIAEPRAVESTELDALVSRLTEVTLRSGAVRGKTASAFVEVRSRLERVGASLASPRAAASRDARGLVEDLRAIVAVAEREVSRAADALDAEAEQARDLAERMRLSPSSSIFGALERAVRDASVTAKKRVELSSFGGDIRIDARTLAAVLQALVQCVRNAVAHGIETPEERARAGKPAVGRIVVGVEHRGRELTFVCRDDGGGIDADAVRRTLAKRGAAGAILDPERAVEAIFESGLSTATTVDELAGRGVGLDVVRRTADALGGTVSVVTKAGEGTTFELVVPFSLAAVDAVLVEVAGTIVAIPTKGVRRALSLMEHALISEENATTVEVDGGEVPFAPLAFVLEGKAGEPRNHWSALALESGGTTVVVGVDRLVRTEAVVMRAPPPVADVHPVVAGAAIDAEGNPRMVLDVGEIVRLAAEFDGVARAPAKSSLPLLVVDDSLTTRMLERSILESAGYEVDVAASAEEGLESVRARAYALVLVDVEMPKMDGFGFVAEVRADPLLCRLPVVLVTSRSAPEDRARGLAAGANDYIVKSEFDQRRLLALVKELGA